MTLDEMNYAEGTDALVAHLASFGWICEKSPTIGYTICKKPGTGVELLLPSIDKWTGKVGIGSRIIPLKG